MKDLYTKQADPTPSKQSEAVKPHNFFALSPCVSMKVNSSPGEQGKKT